MENFRLKVFRSVCDHLSFRRAAEELHLSQPAITQQIKALEEELSYTAAGSHRRSSGVDCGGTGTQKAG